MWATQGSAKTGQNVKTASFAMSRNQEKDILKK